MKRYFQKMKPVLNHFFRYTVKVVDKNKKQTIFFKKNLTPTTRDKWDQRAPRWTRYVVAQVICDLVSVLSLSSYFAMSWRSLILVWYSLQLLAGWSPQYLLEAACNSQVLTSESGLTSLFYDTKSSVLLVWQAWNVALGHTISRGSGWTLQPKI